MVLTENVEHVDELARLLSGWTLVTANDAFPTAMPPQSNNPTRGTIATWMGLERCQLADANVLVRADGGMGQLPVRDLVGGGSPILFNVNNCSYTPDRLNRRLLVVDFDDRYHPVLRRWSRRRWRAYAEQGWFSPGVDPVQARIQRFLAT